jgi:riboflavin synthase alpha subunit
MVLVPQTSLNVQEAYRSLEKFLNLEIDAVICYHGGLCEQDAKNQIKQLLQENRAKNG